MKKIVLFTGSGLSKSLAEIPIQGEFLPAVLNAERKRWVLDLLPIDEQVILTGWDNCETLLSYLYYQDMVSKEKCNSRLYKRAIINFRMALNEYLLLFSKKIKKNEKKKFISLLGKIENITKEKCTIITTNYDLVMEKIIGEKNYSYNLLEENQDINKHIVLKLHGSVNWVEERNVLLTGELTGRYKNNELIGHVNNNLRFFSKYNRFCFPSSCLFFDRDKKLYRSRNKSIYYTPITIPFFFQKFDWYAERWSCIFKKRIWEEAGKELSDADCIIFIGWGNAPADYPLLALFHKARLYQKKIIVIDQDAENLAKYLKMCCCVSGKYLQDFENNDFEKWLDFILNQI